MAQVFFPEFGMGSADEEGSIFTPEFGMIVGGEGGEPPEPPEGPTMDKVMRHGTWFSEGVKQPMTF